MRNFYPFDRIYETDNEEIDGLLKLLDLSKARLALLWELLRRFEINVWFDDDDKSDPHLTVNTFWNMNHVGSMPLIELLEHIVFFDENHQDIGRDAEIVALTKLKSLVEQAIASRQKTEAEAAA